MIGVLKVKEGFEHSQMPILDDNRRKFAAEFPENHCDFFYTLSASRVERFFIIRVDTKDTATFVRAVETFGANMNFEVLKRAEAEAVLRVNDIDKFV